VQTKNWLKKIVRVTSNTCREKLTNLSANNIALVRMGDELSALRKHCTVTLLLSSLQTLRNDSLIQWTLCVLKRLTSLCENASVSYTREQEYISFEFQFSASFHSGPTDPNGTDERQHSVYAGEGRLQVNR